MAIKAIGINLWSIIGIFIGFGILMAAFNFGVNELLKPDSYTHSMDLKESYFKQTSKIEKDTILKDLTMYGSKNRIFVINSYDVKRQQMSNVIISESDRNNQLLKQIVAKRAQWLDGYWMFYDCIISEYVDGKLKQAPTHFQEEVIVIDELPKDISRANIQPNFMNYWQLKKYIRRLQSNGFDANKELVEFYSKIAFPLANVIMIFFVVPFTLTQKRNSSAIMGITISIIISFSYWTVHAINLSLGKIGVLPPLLAAWLTNIIFLVSGLWLSETTKK